jgi:predicted nucleotidyltransferase
MDPRVEELSRRLVEALTPIRIYLFGSRSLGTADSESDYDILVVAETDLPMEERVLLARRAVGHIPVAKDIFIYTPAEFAQYSNWLSGVVREAVSRGRILYEAA